MKSSLEALRENTAPLMKGDILQINETLSFIANSIITAKMTDCKEKRII